MTNWGNELVAASIAHRNCFGNPTRRLLVWFRSKRVCDLESNRNSDAAETGEGAIGDCECVKCWVCKENSLDILIMVLEERKNVSAPVDLESRVVRKLLDKGSKRLELEEIGKGQC